MQLFCELLHADQLAQEVAALGSFWRIMGIHIIPNTIPSSIWVRCKSSGNSGANNNNSCSLNTYGISHDIHEIDEIDETQ
jgi:hypothetical protein